MIRLGYPTQNLTIPASTNRTLRLASLANPDKLRALIEENLQGIRTILPWNAAHGIPLFRIGQSVIPFASHPDFPYDWVDVHGDELRAIGELARSLGIRLSMHPGQFIQPGSPKPGVTERSLAELHFVTAFFDLIGSPDSVVVLHMGGAYDDRATTAARFVETMRPEESTLRYLALENDERIWAVPEIVETAEALGLPAIVDAFHHSLNPGGLTLAEAVHLGLPTWAARGVRPKLHLSSQDAAKQPGAHAYLVEVEDWQRLVEALDGRDADVMVEAKGKELALVPLGIAIEPPADPATPPTTDAGSDPPAQDSGNRGV